MAATSHLIVRNGRIVDARGERAETADILITDGRIEAIEHAGIPAGAERLAGADELDVAGLTIVPGLMNAHAHITLDGSADPTAALAAETRTETVVRSMWRLEETVRAGVTTTRDLGGADHIDIELRQLVERGEIIGPRMLTAGHLITMTGGHGHWFGREADGPDGVRRAVRDEIKAGATTVKMMATGGMMTPNQRAGAAQFTREELAAGVEEAHKADRIATVHSEGDEGSRNAILAGVDSVDHGHAITAATLDLMLEHGTVLVPTVLTDRVIVEGGTEAGILDFVVEKCRGLADTLIRAVEIALEKQVPIAAGNDGGAPLVQVGDMAQELELLEEIGMHPRDALATATTNTAALFRMPDVGLVEPGYGADLLAVRGDPLAGAVALRDPAVVILRGRVVKAP